MIGIVDYGLGNLASVAGAVMHLQHEYVVSSQSTALEGCEKLILPGVGAFGDGMRNLQARGLDTILNRLVLDRRTPILCICLGSQLIASGSEEFGWHRGLGWITARAVRLTPSGDDLRIPHVGWDELIATKDSALLANIPRDAVFYYVHSYRLDSIDQDLVVGECDYGGRFPAMIETGNIYATLFHPEKSQRHGLTLLRNFLDRG